MKKIFLPVIFILILLVSSCATSRITSSWKSEEIKPRFYSKIMVVGMIREADRTLREQMEEHLTNDLKTLGYNAFSAYKVYGPKALEQLNEQDIYDRLHKDGVDAVLTIVLLDKQRERYYYNRYIYYSPYVVYSNHFYGYYRTMWWRIESPGYYQVSTNYFWESNLYDLDAGKLIYSVQTQSFNPDSKDGLAHEYGKLIVQKMEKANVLSKQEEKQTKPL